MRWGEIALWAGIVGVWFGSLYWCHYHGEREGRIGALEDALGGCDWLTRQPQPDGKAEHVARMLAIALATFGKEAVNYCGHPNDVTRMLAQTAVTAMRHPTREMLAAVETHLHPDVMLAFQTYYELMIDAAARPDAGPAARGVSPHQVAAIRMALEPFTKHLGEVNGH